MTTRSWSEQQREIFSWFANGQGHLVVRARAGTGKTTTIIEGINQAPEGRVLLAAFNKRIAEELAQRLENPNTIVKTLHAIGFGVLRRYWERVRVASGNDRINALVEATCGPLVPDAVKRLIGRLCTKAREIAPHATEVGDLVPLIYTYDCEPDEGWREDGFGVSFLAKKALAAMTLAAEKQPLDTGIDFADMIYLPLRNRWLRPSYDLVVVDEAQDMTAAQLEIALGVCRPGGRIAVVGDDRQAIYAFRGADATSLDRLKHTLEAQELGLTTTYRCGKTIVDVARRIVPDIRAGATNGPGGVYHLNLDHLLDRVEVGDFVLSRKNAPLVKIAMSLLRHGVRARVAGRDIGKGLKTLIKTLSRGQGSTVPGFLRKLTAWEDRRVSRLLAADREDKIEEVKDQAEMIRMLSDNATSVQELIVRTEALFSDNGVDTVVCSSVHRAKGLEAKRVFLLDDTLYPRGQYDEEGNLYVEEANIEYVAVTRAIESLVRVGEHYHTTF